jgi:hypothetical protein
MPLFVSNGVPSRATKLEGIRFNKPHEIIRIKAKIPMKKPLF